MCNETSMFFFLTCSACARDMCGAYKNVFDELDCSNGSVLKIQYPLNLNLRKASE